MHFHFPPKNIRRMAAGIQTRVVTTQTRWGTKFRAVLCLTGDSVTLATENSQLKPRQEWNGAAARRAERETWISPFLERTRPCQHQNTSAILKHWPLPWLENLPGCCCFSSKLGSFSFCQETHQMSTSISKGNKYPQAQCHVSGCLASWQSGNGMWSFSRRASDEDNFFFSYSS